MEQLQTDVARDDKATASMASREQWERTGVHQASTYSCGKCGKAFPTPHDVYAHLDSAHA